MSINLLEIEENCIASIEKNNLEKVKQLLSCGLSINSLLRSRYKIWDTNCFSILSIASYLGSINIVEWLIQRNVHINQTDSLKNRTALHWAVASGHNAIAELLIEAGAIVNVLDRDSVTPLILAAHSGDLNLVRTLIKSGADVNLSDRMNSSALHYACIRLHSSIAIELIKNGCVSNANTHFSMFSPLKYLVVDKQYNTARCLIESGCDLFHEKWILDAAFIFNNKIDPEFIKWVRDYIKTPPKLASRCRQKIRSYIGNQHLYDKVQTLNIPKHLKEFLMMKY